MDVINDTESKAPININDYSSNINQNNSNENFEDDTVPVSKWRYLCHIPLFWKINDDRKIHCHYTEETFYPYYFCHLVFIFIYLYYVYYLSEFVQSQRIFNILTFLFILTNVCYVITHFSNPGILPFNWAKTRQRKYTDDELKSGFAVTPEQINYGKTHDFPPRAFFSGHYGAIILRGDHNCFWINHWIGLYNLRYFTQSVFYCFAFYIVYLYAIFLAWRNPNSGRFYFSIKFILCFVFLNFFGITHGVNLYSTLRRIASNYTTLELLLKLDLTYYDKGLVQNFQEVFGSIYLFPLWFFPVPLPLPMDGFGYPPRPNDTCFANQRTATPETIESNE